MVAYKFFTLLHKIARFGPFLANFSLKINNGGATIIRYSRVVEKLNTMYVGLISFLYQWDMNRKSSFITLSVNKRCENK